MRSTAAGSSRLEPAQHLAEGQVRQGPPGLTQAVTDQDGPARRAGPGGRVGQQAGLADAGVTGQQHEPSGGVVVETKQVGKPRRLGVAADEQPLRHTLETHAADYVGEVRQCGQGFGVPAEGCSGGPGTWGSHDRDA